MQSKIFIPSLHKDGFTSASNDERDTLFDKIKNSSYQRRVSMSKHPLLWLAAQRKADDMAKNNYFSHFSPTGVSPNKVVRSVGYPLPNHYPDNKNNVESLAIGGDDADQTIKAWLKSKTGHRIHVFGENDFYKEQECIGIGRSVAKDGRIISVFMSAPCPGESS